MKENEQTTKENTSDGISKAERRRQRREGWSEERQEKRLKNRLKLEQERAEERITGSKNGIVMYSRDIDLEDREDVKAFLMEFLANDKTGTYTTIHELLNVQTYAIHKAIVNFRLEDDEELQWEVNRILSLQRAQALRQALGDPKNATTGIKIIASTEQREKLSASWKVDESEKKQQNKIEIQHS